MYPSRIQMKQMVRFGTVAITKRTMILVKYGSDQSYPMIRCGCSSSSHSRRCHSFLSGSIRVQCYNYDTRVSSIRLFRSSAILGSSNNDEDDSNDNLKPPNQDDEEENTPTKNPPDSSSSSSSSPLLYSWEPPAYRPKGTVWKLCHACKGTGKVPDKVKSKADVYFEELKTGEENIERGWVRCKRCSSRTQYYGYPRGLSRNVRQRQRPRLVDDDDTELIDRDDEYSYTDPSQPQMMPFKIIIIGAGISGLTTAIALRHRGFRRVDVYDARSGPNDFITPQHGYTLQLTHPDPIWSNLGFRPIPDIPTTVRAAPHFLMSGIDGEPIGLRYYVGDDPPFSPSSVKEHVIHVAKPALWHELYQTASTATINDVGDEEIATVVHWNHEFRGFRAHEDRVEVVLAKKSTGPNREITERVFTKTADLLVGADGLRSAVRAQLIPRDIESPVRYLGCLAVTGISSRRKIELRDPSVRQWIDGKTTFQAADGETHWIVQPYNELKKEIAWQVSFRIPLKDAKQLIANGSTALLEEAMRRCGHWPTPIPDVLRASAGALVTGHCVCDREMTPALKSRILQHSHNDNTEPEPEQPPSTPVLNERVTLIGDAAHPTALFKGQGALHAMKDGLSLARLLYRHAVPGNPTSSYSKIFENDDPEEMQFPAFLVHESVRQFRKEMMERVARPMADAEETVRYLHTKASLFEKGTIRRVPTVNKQSLTEKS